MRGLHAADNEQIKNQNHNPLTLALSPRGERGQSQSIAGSRDESHSAIRTVQFAQCNSNSAIRTVQFEQCNSNSV
jgi:hypothetical protein